jgi:hypothetical protein
LLSSRDMLFLPFFLNLFQHWTFPLWILISSATNNFLYLF